MTGPTESEVTITRMHRCALALILLSIGISVAWGVSLAQNDYGWSDFKAIYYAERCLIQHNDPYNSDEFETVYRAEGGRFPSDPVQLLMFRRAVPVFCNLPTTLLLFAPWAMLSWGPAHLLWILPLAASIFLAAYLVWRASKDYASGTSLFLICLLAANCEFVIMSGRSAMFAIDLCVIAVWCLLEGRFLPAGVLCLGLSMVIKPHDTGFVWLYFFLAGGTYRKRALQALAVVVALAVPAILWVSHISPHWLIELHANLSATGARGGLADPGPASISMSFPVRVIDLQTVISVFRDSPEFYNPVSYLVGGVFLLAWSVHTLKSRFSHRSALVALAAISALSMLPTYHRQYDAKLLLLAVPACAMLSAEGGRTGKTALLLTTLGLCLTGDIPTVLLTIIYNKVHPGTAALGGKIMIVVLERSAPLILLAIGIFYLWVYVRRAPDQRANALE